MKNEDLISFLKGLPASIHEEYHDGGINCVLDVHDNKVVITASLNSEREKFEEWIQKLDDDIFTEAWERLVTILPNAVEMYASDNYPKVISEFKKCTRKVVEDKINNLKALF